MSHIGEGITRDAILARRGKPLTSYAIYLSYISGAAVYFEIPVSSWHALRRGRACRRRRSTALPRLDDRH